MIEYTNAIEWGIERSILSLVWNGFGSIDQISNTDLKAIIMEDMEA